MRRTASLLFLLLPGCISSAPDVPNPAGLTEGAWALYEVTGAGSGTAQFTLRSDDWTLTSDLRRIPAYDLAIKWNVSGAPRQYRQLLDGDFRILAELGEIGGERERIDVNYYSTGAPSLLADAVSPASGASGEAEAVYGLPLRMRSLTVQRAAEATWPSSATDGAFHLRLVEEGPGEGLPLGALPPATAGGWEAPRARWTGALPPRGVDPDGFPLAEAWEWARGNDPGLLLFLQQHPEARILQTFSLATLVFEVGANVSTFERSIFADDGVAGYELHLRKRGLTNGPGIVEIDRSGPAPSRCQSPPPESLVLYARAVERSSLLVPSPYLFGSFTCTIPGRGDSQLSAPDLVYRVYLAPPEEERNSLLQTPIEVRWTASSGRLEHAFLTPGQWERLKTQRFG